MMTVKSKFFIYGFPLILGIIATVLMLRMPSGAQKTPKKETKTELAVAPVVMEETKPPEEIKPPEEMVLEKTSIKQGVGKVTGRPYRFYLMIIYDEKKANCAGATEKAPARQQVKENRLTGILNKAAGWLSGIFRRRRP